MIALCIFQKINQIKKVETFRCTGVLKQNRLGVVQQMGKDLKFHLKKKLNSTLKENIHTDGQYLNDEFFL